MNSRRAMGSFILRCRPLSLALVAASTNLSFSQSPQPAVLVVSAADYRTYVAPQSEAAVLGANLADSTAWGQVDATGQLNTELAGTTVQVCGEAAGLISVFPMQINMVVPSDLKSRICPVVVTTKGRMSTGTADIRLVSPAFFTKTRYEDHTREQTFFEPGGKAVLQRLTVLEKDWSIASIRYQLPNGASPQDAPALNRVVGAIVPLGGEQYVVTTWDDHGNWTEKKLIFQPLIGAPITQSIHRRRITYR